MSFNEKFIAVGVTGESEDLNSGVVVVVAGLGKFTMIEADARKLADDILRNANYLWPSQDERLWQMERDAREAKHKIEEEMRKL